MSEGMSNAEKHRWELLQKAEDEVADKKQRQRIAGAFQIASGDFAGSEGLSHRATEDQLNNSARAYLRMADAIIAAAGDGAK